MDIIQFKRNVSLFKLGIGELSEVELELYCFFKEHISELKPFYSDDYADCVFWGKSKEEIVLVYDHLFNRLKVEEFVWYFINKLCISITSMLIIDYIKLSKDNGTYVYCGSHSINKKYPKLQLSIYEKK